MKLWGSRFNKKSDKLLDNFTGSFSFDKLLFKQEVLLNIAHAKMLKKCKIIPELSANKIISGLSQILKEEDKLNQNAEDIHTAIEERLYQIIGDNAGYLHTAKSRNDQVATSTRMYIKQEIINIKSKLLNLQKTILHLSEKYIDFILPGFTHLQNAQPILLSHYLLAFFEMFKRDYYNLQHTYSISDVMPLGSCALSGTSFDIDRIYTAKILGFSKISENSIDSVSDRDFIIEFIFSISLLFTHLSRFCEDIIIWSTQQFLFCEISDKFTTGSSIMPQKKNPDIAELIRGKTGRIYGNLISILTVMKALPLSYNRDMQEDKEILFDTVDTAKDVLEVFNKMLKDIKFNKEKMFFSAKDGFTTATDVADYLVKKNIPFREAHSIVGKIVDYCIKNNKNLEMLELSEFKNFSEKFEDDIRDVIDIKKSINSKKSYGSTSKNSVKMQIKKGKKWLCGLLV